MNEREFVDPNRRLRLRRKKKANSHPKCNDVEKQKDITARSR